jgi:hypothetical protein
MKELSTTFHQKLANAREKKKSPSYHLTLVKSRLKTSEKAKEKRKHAQKLSEKNHIPFISIFKPFSL